MSLFARAGSRPDVSTTGPQRQLSQKSSPALWGQLIDAVFALDGVVEGHSQVSPASSRGVFLADHEFEGAANTNLAPGRRLEPVHIHGVQDTSLHLCIPAARGHELTELGWAQPHQYEDFGTEFLIYGPRDSDELAVVIGIVEESLAFARMAAASAPHTPNSSAPPQ